MRTPFLLLTVISVTTIIVALSPSDGVGQTVRRSHLTPGLVEPPPTLPLDKNQTEDISINEWLQKERIIFLSGEIDSTLAESVIAQLMHMDSQAPGKDIYLYINSPGGAITAGMAIYDTIQALKSDVVTVCIGQASSMASILLSSGEKGKRFSLLNARIMIHQPWTYFSGGQASDIAIEAKEILYLKNRLNRLLAERTGQSLTRIETDVDRDFFMSAEDAKAYGIVDRVVNKLPSMSNPAGK